MPTTISRRLIAQAICTRLVGVTHATGYYGQVGALNGLPGTTGTTGTPADPPVKSDDDQRVRPYFVLEPGVGRPGTELDLGDTLVDLDQPFTIRAAAGDIDDLLALIDRIDTLLYRWAPVVDGFQCGPLRYPPGFVPPLLPDNQVQPPRHFAPLQYVLTAFS